MDVFKHSENVSTLGGTLGVTAFSAYCTEVGTIKLYNYLKAKSKGYWGCNETAYLAKKCFFQF